MLKFYVPIALPGWHSLRQNCHKYFYLHKKFLMAILLLLVDIFSKYLYKLKVKDGRVKRFDNRPPNRITKMINSLQVSLINRNLNFINTLYNNVLSSKTLSFLIFSEIICVDFSASCYFYYTYKSLRIFILTNNFPKFQILLLFTVLLTSGHFKTNTLSS